MRVTRLMLAAGMGVLLAGCSDFSSPGHAAKFSDVQQVFKTDCAGCHDNNAGHLNLIPDFYTDMDSASLVASGYINPENPDQSIVILKPRLAAPHGGGRIESFASGDESVLRNWIARQPRDYSYVLRAEKIDQASAPVVDGKADEQAWSLASPTTFPIGGGWADADRAVLRAAYDGEYIYLVMQWKDDKASDRRQPWVKQSDGSWKTAPAKPLPYDGYTWGPTSDAEKSANAYEDKVALMWNTYGANTVAGFDRSGCAVTCHDPENNFRPGKTYFYSNENRAAKKYTNTPGEIADIWHWKFVRMNQHYKLDDQYVQFWEPNTGSPKDGGRASDEGSGGYADNIATNGKPTYRSKGSITAPPFYILNNEKQLLTAQELAGLPVGAMIPNMITAGPTGKRADVDARGNHDPLTGMWTLEIRRKMVTGDDKDVQFDNLLREYVFGVAVFDNAQIEHSYSTTPIRLVFPR